jgi:hypothetical protein
MGDSASRKENHPENVSVLRGRHRPLLLSVRPKEAQGVPIAGANCDFSLQSNQDILHQWDGLFLVSFSPHLIPRWFYIAILYGIP